MSPADSHLAARPPPGGSWALPEAIWASSRIPFGGAMAMFVPCAEASLTDGLVYSSYSCSNLSKCYEFKVLLSSVYLRNSVVVNTELTDSFLMSALASTSVGTKLITVVCLSRLGSRSCQFSSSAAWPPVNSCYGMLPSSSTSDPSAGLTCLKDNSFGY